MNTGATKELQFILPQEAEIYTEIKVIIKYGNKKIEKFKSKNEMILNGRSVYVVLSPAETFKFKDLSVTTQLIANFGGKILASDMFNVDVDELLDYTSLI